MLRLCLAFLSFLLRSTPGKIGNEVTGWYKFTVYQTHVSAINYTFFSSFSQVKYPLLSVYCRPKYHTSRRPTVLTTCNRSKFYTDCYWPCHNSWIVIAWKINIDSLDINMPDCLARHTRIRYKGWGCSWRIKYCKISRRVFSATLQLKVTD